MTDSKVETLYSVYVANSKCNLKCEYCETSKSDFLREIDECMRNENFTHHNKILAESRKIYNSKILKVVGGGEIFLDKDIYKWIKQEEKNYEKIFILTNGVQIEPHLIELISTINNLIVGISLDGYTLEMNGYRFTKQKFENVLKTFHALGANGVPLQINMVIHDLNGENFFEYLYFLMNLQYSITLHMSPVMPKTSSEIECQDRDNWVRCLQKLLDKYENYKKILLPKAYYRSLLEFYLNGCKRKTRCYIPYFMVQLFASGEMTSCPIIWNTHIGNVNEYRGNLFEENIYKLLCGNDRRPFFCRKCASSYDIFSLYVENIINEDELRAIPLYSSEIIISQIKKIKQKIREEKDEIN